MSKGRLEAFSDGVMAIILTIMVLELKVPEDGTLEALVPLLPKFLSYVLSFVFLGIYWNNHHHLWQGANSVNGAILWANMHLLFWLSLIPFTTAWMGEHFGAIPVAVYGAVLWLSGVAYYFLVRAMLAHHGEGSLLASAIGNNRKEMASLFIYTAAIPLAFVAAWIAAALYVVVAVIWLIPDRRIESMMVK